MNSNAPTQLLYDGLCPICSREAHWLKRKDRQGGLELVDITDDTFDADRYGLDRAVVHRELHAIRPDGQVLVGMAAVREMYQAVGKGWMMAWTGWPVLRWFCDLGYRVFARIRPWFSKAEMNACDDGACRV